MDAARLLGCEDRPFEEGALVPVMTKPIATNAPSGKIVSTPIRNSYRRIRSPLLIVCAVVAMVGFVMYGGRGGSYERGFGDTVLTYANRAYDGATWKKDRGMDSLVAIANDEGGHHWFSGIIGWDDESFWLFCAANGSRGMVFGCQNGHWSYLGAAEHLNVPFGRALSRDTVYVTSSYQSPALYRITPGKWEKCAEIEGGDYHSGELCIVSSDLLYSLHDHHSVKLAGDSVTSLKVNTHKEAFVHRRDNTPLREYPIDLITLTRTTVEGNAYGIARRSVGSERKLVRFENGLWYEVDDLPSHDGGIQCIWLTGPAKSPRYLIGGGQKGRVLVHEVGGKSCEQPITLSQENTSGDLIAAWGSSPERYWVMDKNGTIWERTETQWRTVVRGLHQEKIHFSAAWVSPTGAVFAVTDETLYRLE